MKKKIVPDPEVPEIGGSSPKWGMAQSTTAESSRWQKPICIRVLSTRQCRGQRVQHSRIFSSRAIFSFNFILPGILISFFQCHARMKHEPISFAYIRMLSDFKQCNHGVVALMSKLIRLRN